MKMREGIGFGPIYGPRPLYWEQDWGSYCKAMEYPERLMGWVNLFDSSMEIRMRHNPNLFEENTYEVYDMHTVSLPIRVMLGNPRGQWHNNTLYITDSDKPWDMGTPINLGSQFLVEAFDDKWKGNMVNGKVNLILKRIPDNIR